MSFEELIEAPELLRAVSDLGWKEPTPVQARAIPSIRTGRDIVGIAQTGTGKTGAFLLPALERQIGTDGLKTLVLCPTRELAQQVAEDGRALTAHAEIWVGEVVGGMPMRPQIRDLRAGFDVLVATPGRLIDHLERGNVDLSGIEVLVLDEADRMLDMGFRPQIETILAACPRQRQTLLFSATMPNGVHALALRVLRDPEWIEVVRQATVAEGIEQEVYSVRADRKTALLLDLLQRPGMDQVLVFTARKIGADLLLVQLEAAGVQAAVMHGDRNMSERRRALDLFDQGKVQVLVATDVAQRGLDIEGISHVVNYDVPRNPEDYVHRIGRTGRAGASGRAITFVSTHDLAPMKDIERMLGYQLERISLPEFDYAGGGNGGSRRIPTAQRSRGGLGSRTLSDLSPEERKKLLGIG